MGVGAYKIPHIPDSDRIIVLFIGIEAAERIGEIYHKRIDIFHCTVDIFRTRSLFTNVFIGLAAPGEEKVGRCAALVAEKLIFLQRIAAIFALSSRFFLFAALLPAFMAFMKLGIDAFTLFFITFTVIGRAAFGADHYIVLRGKFFSAGLTFTACIVKQNNASFAQFVNGAVLVTVYIIARFSSNYKEFYYFHLFNTIISLYTYCKYVRL